MTRIDRMGCACGSPMCVPGGRGGRGLDCLQTQIPRVVERASVRGHGRQWGEW